MAKFRKRGDTWEYRIYYKDPYSGKFKEKSRGGFAKQSEAKNAAREMEKQLAEGLEQGPLSLKHYLHEWLYEYKKGSIRKNTFELHEANIKNHILPHFLEIQLRELKPVMYQKFLNSLTKKGYSRRTVEIVHTTMYNAMEKAVILNKLEKNPCRGVTIKGEKKENVLKFIDSDDVPGFLQNAYEYGYIYWIFFKVLIETGMRKGEAASLQWSDIDLKNQTIHIWKTLDFKAKNEDELFGDPKTYRSNRTISISQSLVNDLRFHMNYQNQNKTTLNDIYRHDLNLVLCRNDGSPMPKSSLFNAFERILKRAELPKLPIHSTRHTHAVLLLEAGADMKYVQERLGHGSMEITSDVYAHVSKKIEKNNMDKYEAHTHKLFE